jgi:hypothetical protein
MKQMLAAKDDCARRLQSRGKVLRKLIEPGAVVKGVLIDIGTAAGKNKRTLRRRVAALVLRFLRHRLLCVAAMPVFAMRQRAPLWRLCARALPPWSRQRPFPHTRLLAAAAGPRLRPAARHAVRKHRCNIDALRL